VDECQKIICSKPKIKRECSERAHIIFVILKKLTILSQTLYRTRPVKGVATRDQEVWLLCAFYPGKHLHRQLIKMSKKRVAAYDYDGESAKRSRRDLDSDSDLEVERDDGLDMYYNCKSL